MKIRFIALFGAALALAPLCAIGAEGPGSAVESTGSLSRADALAKAGEHDEAIALLESFLAQNPGHVDGQLLYARTLSWMGEYDRAISVYAGIIKREPRNAEAHAGVGRVRSWKGEYDSAVESFRRSLEMAPSDDETRTALARTLWWKGDSKGALAELSAVLAQDPENPEALGLERRLRQDRGPSAKAVFVNASDSDRNRIKSYQASFVDTFGLSGHRFEFGWKRFESTLPFRSASASFVDVKDSIRVFDKSVLTPRLSLVSLDSDAGDAVYLTEGLGFNTSLARGAALNASYSRYPLVDTAVLIENNIRVREAALAFSAEAGGATLSASALSASYSDGNSRYDLAAGAAARIFREPSVIAGAISQYRRFSERKANGYFNPPHILSNSVYLDVSGRLLQKAAYRAKAALGTQSYERGSDYTTSFQAGLEWEATRDLTLEALWKYSRSALESASGFRFEEYRFGVNYLF